MTGGHGHHGASGNSGGHAHSFGFNGEITVAALVVSVLAGWLGGSGHGGDGGGHTVGPNLDTSGGTTGHGGSASIDSRLPQPHIRQLLATAPELTRLAARILLAAQIDWELNLGQWFANVGAPGSGLVLGDNHMINQVQVEYRPKPGVLLGLNLDSDDADPNIQKARPLSADFIGATGDTETWVFQFLLGEVDDNGITKWEWQGHAGIQQKVRVHVAGSKVKLVVHVRRFTINVKSGYKDCEYVIWAEIQDYAGCTEKELAEMCRRANIFLDKLQAKLASTPASIGTIRARETLPHMGIRSLTSSEQEPATVSATAPAGNATTVTAPVGGSSANRRVDPYPPRAGNLP